jgi:hypothetical protein
MMLKHTVSGLIGRGVATAGAVVVGLSLTLSFYDGGGDFSFWEVLEKTRYGVLVCAVMVVLLVVVSLVAAPELSLLGAALFASFPLGYYVLVWVDSDGLGNAWKVGAAGAATALVGALTALIPMLAGRGEQSAELAFLPHGGVEAPSTGGPVAGWYPDPADQARLRFWDGLEWTEHTR